MSRTVVVAGVGVVPFVMPGPGNGYAAMGARAIRAALADARLDFDLVEQAVAAFVHADSGAGQRVFGEVGMTGIPLLNVSNRCASGATAFHWACREVFSGASECVVAAGFDEFLSVPGAPTFPRLADPLECYRASLAKITGAATGAAGDPFLRDLSSALLDHLRKERRIPESVFARIAAKARAHARGNELALLRSPLALDDLLAEAGPGRPMPAAYSSAVASGAAAVVVCCGRFAARYGLRHDVGVLASVLGGPAAEDLESSQVLDILGRSLSRRTAQAAYERAGLGPADLDLVELDDQCVASEAISYDALGLCAEDEIPEFVLDGRNTYGGRLPVGTSGGMLARGHSPGATGLAQIAELTWQLREQAGERQVPRAQTGLAHNLAVGTAAVVSILQRAR